MEGCRGSCYTPDDTVDNVKSVCRDGRGTEVEFQGNLRFQNLTVMEQLFQSYWNAFEILTQLEIYINPAEISNC